MGCLVKENLPGNCEIYNKVWSQRKKQMHTLQGGKGKEITGTVFSGPDQEQFCETVNL